MGFIGTHNIILNSDMKIDESSTMSYKNKIIDISTYKESENIEIIRPTIMICEYFKEKIEYIIASPRAYTIRSGRLYVYALFTNLYEFTSEDDMIKHLSDDNKDFYLSKVIKYNYVHNTIWKLYVAEIDNKSSVRNKKIDLVLNNL